MSLNEESLTLIQKYLSNSLTLNEQKLFDASLENLEFKKELVKQAEMVDALETIEDRKIRKMLKNSNSTKPAKNGFNPLWLILALALAVGAYFASQKLIDSSPNYTTLIAEYNQAYPPYIIERGKADKYPDDYKSAMFAYSNRNYEQADRLFQAIRPASEELTLYRANCLLQLKQYEKAEIVLHSIEDSSIPKIFQNAQWYRIMVHLGKGEQEKAIAILEKIIAYEDFHLFTDQAKTLLEKLK